MDFAVRQIISRVVASEGVVNIFAAAGLDKPDISVLSDEFLAEVQGMPQRNLAVELPQKLLRGEVSTKRRKNVVQARSFAKMLEQTLRRYQNRAIEAAQVIEELIDLAQEMREANQRGERLGLSEDELAFYDALETNDSAVQVHGHKTLRDIARQLVETVRNNVTIDWTLRQNVRANLRRLVRRILRKHGYPPDKQGKATQTLMKRGSGSCDTPRLNARRFEKLVVDKIRSNIFTEGSFPTLVNAVDEQIDGMVAEHRKRVQTIESEIRDVKKQLDRIWRHIATGDNVDVAQTSVRMAEYQDRQERLEDAAANARETLAQHRSALGDAGEIAAYVREMDDFLDSSELAEHRAFIESFVREVVVMPGAALIRYTMPMPDDSRIPGRVTETMTLDGSALPTMRVDGD